jgi:hypothetical protein
MTDWQFTYRQDDHLFLSVKGRELGTSGLRKERRQGAEVRAGQSGSKFLQNIDEETVSEKEGKEGNCGLLLSRSCNIPGKCSGFRRPDHRQSEL